MSKDIMLCNDCGNVVDTNNPETHVCPSSSVHHDRIGRADLYMEMARLLARRSTCVRGQVGAVLVHDRRVVATGYNGAPPGEPHCTEVGCDMSDGPEAGCQRIVHAEANLVAYAARHGQACEGATLYSTASPCLKCAQLILSAGIKAVIYENPYRRPQGIDLLSKHVEVIQHLWTPHG